MQSDRFRILCTEDDGDTRDLITFVLNRNNCDVVTTETPFQAIELAKSTRFDLYLVDNWMPRILFYSGAAYPKDKAEAYASGAQGYLVKPADNHELVAEVLRLVSESRAKRMTRGPELSTEKTFSQNA